MLIIIPLIIRSLTHNSKKSRHVYDIPSICFQPGIVELEKGWYGKGRNAP